LEDRVTFKFDTLPSGSEEPFYYALKGLARSINYIPKRWVLD